MTNTRKSGQATKTKVKVDLQNFRRVDVKETKSSDKRLKSFKKKITTMFQVGF